MEFRWIALITLWTLLAGPVFDSPLDPSRSRRPPTYQAARPSTAHK